MAQLDGAPGDVEANLSQARQLYQRRRQERIEQQSSLVEFRLYWDTLTQMLAGRSKVLIDAEKLPGRRTLWLVPFEPGQAPALVPRRSRTAERDEP